jgi:hypothetical protein
MKLILNFLKLDQLVQIFKGKQVDSFIQMFIDGLEQRAASEVRIACSQQET